VNNKLIIACLACLAFAPNAFAADDKPQTETEKLSYAIGFQIGQSLKRDNMQLDTKVLSQAIEDVLQGKPLKLTMDEMRGAVESMQKKQMEAQAAKGKEAKQRGEEFLAKNKGKPGVKTLPSGLQYKVIKSGKGKQPMANDKITAHYEGTLIDGTVFDSSYKRGEPATFGVNQVIKGWQEILPMMHEGDKWEVYIPSDMAYGPSGAGGSIGPNETLIFTIELIKVN
jgi:FKBP-type peptidyl-prolyl cis-trans isomerase FklB